MTSFVWGTPVSDADLLITKEMAEKSMNSIPAIKSQVGGDHYKNRTIQPIEYIIANDLTFPEGSAIKYITRHKEKGGEEDIDKAIHYLQFIKEFVYGKNSNS